MYDRRDEHETHRSRLPSVSNIRMRSTLSDVNFSLKKHIGSPLRESRTSSLLVSPSPPMKKIDIHFEAPKQQLPSLSKRRRVSDVSELMPLNGRIPGDPKNTFIPSLDDIYKEIDICAPQEDVFTQMFKQKQAPATHPDVEKVLRGFNM